MAFTLETSPDRAAVKAPSPSQIGILNGTRPYGELSIATDLT